MVIDMLLECEQVSSHERIWGKLLASLNLEVGRAMPALRTRVEDVAVREQYKCLNFILCTVNCYITR